MADVLTENLVDFSELSQDMAFIPTTSQDVLVGRQIFFGLGWSQTGEEQTSFVSQGHWQNFVQTTPK